MTTCVPIRDLKDTAQFSRLVESSTEPITVTKNGYDAFVVMKVDDYDLLCEQAAKARLLSRLALAQNEIEEGAYQNVEVFTTGLRERYGL